MRVDRLRYWPNSNLFCKQFNALSNRVKTNSYKVLLFDYLNTSHPERVKGKSSGVLYIYFFLFENLMSKINFLSTAATMKKEDLQKMNGNEDVTSSSSDNHVEGEEENEMKIKPSYSTTPSLHSILSRDKKGALAVSFSSSAQPSDDDYVINLIENIEIPTQENLKVM